MDILNFFIRVAVISFFVWLGRRYAFKDGYRCGYNDSECHMGNKLNERISRYI